MVHGENKRYQKGLVIGEPQGYMIIRFRHKIEVFCVCGVVIGVFPQRGESKLRGECYRCVKVVPVSTITTIIKNWVVRRGSAEDRGGGGEAPPRTRDITDQEVSS